MLTNISAAILTGGKNSRMNGRNKAFTKIGNESILDSMWNIIEPLFGEVFFVTNVVDPIYRQYQATIISDVVPDKGPLSGIHSALKHTTNKYCFVFACDLPYISPDIIIKQAEMVDSVTDAVVPRHFRGIEPLHTLWSANCFSVLDKYLNGLQNYKISLFLNTLQVKYFDTQNSQSFVNINSPEDLQLLQNKSLLKNEYGSVQTNY